MLNEFVYCPRLFHLEWVQQQFATSDDVEEGNYLHRVVDQETGDLPDKSEAWAGRAARSVSLSSRRLGLTTRIDMVEDGGDGTVVPVDYKKGHPDKDGEAWPSDRVQSLVQAALLQEAGYVVERAEIWYAETRQRVHITVNDAALKEITETVAKAWKIAAQPMAPPPLHDSPRCPRCSLVGICLPDEMESLHSPPTQRRPLKRLMAPILEGRPVYVTVQGAVVGIRHERLEIRLKGELQASYRLIDISQVCIFGNVTVSAQAVRSLIPRDIPVLWFSYGGWFIGITEGLPGKNVDLRIAQFRIPESRKLEIARRMISGKIRNSRTMLRRNSRTSTKNVGDQLKSLALQATEAESPQQLLGIEGVAARLYFENFISLISKDARIDVSGFSEGGRTRRPPEDPVNTLLSFCYSLLIKDLTVTLEAVGFDPYYGMFHRPRFGRPALALDLAEEFRSLVAESVVLQVLNNGEVGSRDFKFRAGGCMLEADGRKAVLRAYERRLDQEITHPQFGYKASYRRIMDIQSRILGAVMIGELDQYTAMMTR
ncbi:CRISPR-associated endonuclease Cas4g/Cas1g [Propionibacterium australiense]|uniref:CRISPR-associated endonuclease Cas1 n=1 Tax=Propionibacterium australiense TaxID=119981 RepID=A0A8B3FTT2_9ACTN|nr:CRISPR-associated endonuclease Cas1 [Propionibacterium australiense]RLP11191.1 CRISPR-associated endonuclease Cas1 [Propionibacterium australiense]